MVFQIFDDRATERDADIGPTHSAVEFAVQFIVLIVRYILEVHDTCVVVILAWEDDFVQVSWVGIGDAVLVSVPSAVAEIEASHESYMAVDKTQLLVVGPIEHLAIRDAIDTLQGISCGFVSIC